MSWISDNLALVLIAGGLVSLIVDVVLLGFATFILFFLGLSLLLSGTAMWIGWLPSTGAAALWSNALFTAVLAAVLWQPLRRFQNRDSSKRIENDFAPAPFVLQQEVDINGHSQYLYSGIKWQLKSQQPISAGTLVAVEKVEVGVLWLVPQVPQ